MKEKIELTLILGEEKPLPPTSFEQVIGQESVISQLNFYLESHEIGLAFPSMLFTGSHGLGKTYVAKILAANLARRFLEINCSTLKFTKDFVENILLEKVMGSTPVTILFDEAHRLSSEVTTILLSILAPNDKGINVIEYKGLGIRYDLTKINTVFATTDSFKIFPPLVNRCQPIYFKSYNTENLIKMLRFYLPNVDLYGFSDDGFSDLAYACRGRGRDTYTLAQKIKRKIGDNSRFTVDEWNDLKEIFGVYPLGLNAQEVALMRVIRDAGAISSSNIATRMMIGEENVSEEIEIRPKELWLVRNTSKGRALTEKGKDYFKTYLKED